MNIFKKEIKKNGRVHIKICGIKIVSYKKQLNKRNNILKPAFKRNSVVVTFASDENYVPYLGVAIKSLIINSDRRHNYDIVVLEDGIKGESREKIKSLKDRKRNISIRFFNVNRILDRYSSDIFFTQSHFSRAAYYRLFVQEIFCRYKKVLYLDSDIVVLDDIANLYNVDIEDEIFGIMPSIARYYKDPDAKFNGNYGRHLKGFVDDINDYWNSAILLFNIPRMIKDGFTSKCLEKLKEYPTPQNVDQDLLNIAYPPKNLYLLDPSWVYTPMYSYLYNEDKDLYTDEFARICDSIKENPKLIHYLTGKKPWVPNSSYIKENIYFWQYLQKTPFYEQVHQGFMKKMAEKIGK